MIYFDPSEIMRGIRQLLISDKKRIGFLFGAGTSLAKKQQDSPIVPAIEKLTELVSNNLKDRYADALASIKQDIEEDNLPFNVETLLSNVEEKINVVGKGSLNGLDKINFIALRDQIKHCILKEVSVHENITNIEQKNKMIQVDFASWIQNANRKYGIEIFTTNYDYLFEIGLEHCDVPYYDGFNGSYQPFFNSQSVESLAYLQNQTKLWKIHGSLGLQQLPSGKVVRVPSKQDAMLIYPSILKYADSKKQPYASFMDRLNLFLKQDDAVLFVCGYSFGDEHINERIISALKSNSDAHVYVFFYDIIWENNRKINSFTAQHPLAKLAKECNKITVLASKCAVQGTKFGEWKLKREPSREDSVDINLYFDEDAPYDSSLPLKQERKGDESWTGKGELTIINFTKFVGFLQNMIPYESGEKDE